MHDTLRRIVHVLDGQPTGARGQSLVELALTAPILILMVLSLVEVGLVANNYLILMDVVRNAARDGVNFIPDPVHWDDVETRNQHRLACNTLDSGLYQLQGNAKTTTDNRPIPRADGIPGYKPGDFSGAYAFFDEVTCQVTKGMSPLVFNDYAQPNGSSYPENTTAKDDIVVSAVSFAKIDYTKIVSPPNGGDPRFNDTQNLQRGPGYAAGPGMYHDSWVTVTGRWPLANRYCVSANGTGDSRDPFDWKRSEFVADWTNGAPGDSYENPGPYYVYDPGTTSMVPRAGGVLGGAGESQMVRGFIFTGRAKDGDCYGSRFTVQAIESKLNLDATWNPNTANGGVVIVELFWQHHPLVLGRLFEGFTGNRADDPVLYAWSWYPVSSVTPTRTPTQPNP